MSAPTNNNQQSATNEDILERIDALTKDIRVMKKAIVIEADTLKTMNDNMKRIYEMVNCAMKVMARDANLKA
jgi:hypothetical protein